MAILQPAAGEKELGSTVHQRDEAIDSFDAKRRIAAGAAPRSEDNARREGHDRSGIQFRISQKPGVCVAHSRCEMARIPAWSHFERVTHGGAPRYVTGDEAGWH
jgi:hypothetical protein